MSQDSSEDALLRALLAAVDAEPPVQAASARAADRRGDLQSGAGMSQGTGPVKKRGLRLGASAAQSRSQVVSHGDAWQATGPSVQDALSAAQRTLGDVQVVSGYRTRTLWGRPRVTLIVQPAGRESPVQGQSADVDWDDPVEPRAVWWTRGALRSLGVPAQTLGYLPLEDPDTSAQWEQAVTRAVSRTLQLASPSSGDVVVVGRGIRGAAACLSAAAAGLPTGFLVLEDGAAPATTERVVRALRRGMPPQALDAEAAEPRGPAPADIDASPDLGLSPEPGENEVSRDRRADSASVASDGPDPGVIPDAESDPGVGENSVTSAPRRRRSSSVGGRSRTKTARDEQGSSASAALDKQTKSASRQGRTSTKNGAGAEARAASGKETATAGESQGASSAQARKAVAAESDGGGVPGAGAAKGTQRKKRASGREVSGG